MHTKILNRDGKKIVAIDVNDARLRLAKQNDIMPKAFQTWASSPVIKNQTDNEILIYGEIVSDADATFQRECFGDESGMSNKMFREQLNAIEGEVVVRVNSPGGNIFEGSGMMQAIQERGDVKVVVDGIAASAASFLVIASSDVTMAVMGQVMIHKPWTYALGDDDEMMKAAGILEQIGGTLATAYAKKTGKTKAEMMDAMKAETWYTAEAAVEIGLADRTFEPEAKKNETELDVKSFINNRASLMAATGVM